MSFRPYQFAGVTLPGYAYKVTGGPRARDNTLRTVGGAVDGDDTYGQWDYPYTMTYSCLVYEDGGIASLGAALDDLRAMIGVEGKLYVSPWDSTAADRWALARCVGVNVPATVYNRKTQNIDIEFRVKTSWRGFAHGGTVSGSSYLFGNGLYYSATSATTLATSPKTITVTNDGNTWVDDCGITVTAGSAAITAITIGISSSSEFTFSGTVSAGNTLIIDCGKRFVRANGIDAYDSFALTANHVIAPWLRLAPGDNSVVVTLTGGDVDSIIQFSYSDGWA